MKELRTTNFFAREMRANLRTCEERKVFGRFKLRYASNRTLEELGRSLSPYDNDHRALIKEYVVTDEEGRYLAETEDGRVLYPVTGPMGQLAGYEIEVPVEKEGETKRRPYRGTPADFHIDPERRAEYEKRHRRLLEEVIDVRLYTVPESECEKEGAIDFEALDGRGPGEPAVNFMFVRWAIIEGNQEGLFEEVEAENEEPAEAAAA